MAIGPRGKHRSLDSYDGTAAPVPEGISGYLIPPPKQINAGDPKRGSPAPGTAKGATINRDTYYE